MVRGKIRELHQKLKSIKDEIDRVMLLSLSRDMENMERSGTTGNQILQQLEGLVATIGRVDGTTQAVETILNTLASRSSTSNLTDESRQEMERQTRYKMLELDWFPTINGTPDDPESSHNYITAVEKYILLSLAYESMVSRQEAISPVFKMTFDWIFSPPTDHREAPWSDFSVWLREDSDQIYWIIGKPGAGKLTLMKFVVQHNALASNLAIWAKGLPVVTASYYLWMAGIHLEHSQEGLTRSLLFQCLKQRPSLLPRVCKKQYALIQALGIDACVPPPWKLSELLHCLKELSSSAVGTLSELNNTAGVKICVSSRPLNLFRDAFWSNPSLKIRELTRGDIEGYTRGRLESTVSFRELSQISSDEAYGLVRAAVSKAYGVFLWVKVVVGMLLQRLDAGAEILTLFAIIDSLPEDLEQLSENIRKKPIIDNEHKHPDISS
ncbi:hypothetical protein QBC38DRAFT_52999 [Podospora fimiseda]|uniref:Nephrocystin 3-like N-terminal domain-containing protein n=1 Tax=Podospora fimiseda TaxID=252190 RepID=A0AAN7GNT6_9PEZI|nr:hypothetical protein QBC38DRAFT_52999 [Podospora fimiseda]